MKQRRESSFTNDELQRELQEVFRKRHWADVQAERAELAEATEKVRALKRQLGSQVAAERPHGARE